VQKAIISAADCKDLKDKEKKVQDAFDQLAADKNSLLGVPAANVSASGCFDLIVHSRRCSGLERLFSLRTMEN